MRVSLIIPAYNEAAGVASTVPALTPVLADLRQRWDTDLILVDDGSQDETRRLLEEAFAGDDRAQIVAHDQNRGLGAALRTGFAAAQGEVVVTTDFDGTYAFALIAPLVEHLLATEAAIVTASPYHPQGAVEGVPRHRLLFSFGASLLYRLLVDWRIHTWTALFRAYRRPVIESLTFESDGFLAGTELLVYARQAGFRVEEYPTTLRVRVFGQSSIRIAQVMQAHLGFQGRLLWRRLTRCLRHA